MIKCDTAREAALKILYEVNEQGAYSNIALNKHLSSHGFSGRDRAFITELVYGVIKWKLTLDRTIAACSDIKMERLSPWIKNVLRLGAYQLLHMTKVPPSAAVNESVKLARRYGHKASAGYVNAVLRNIAGGGGKEIFPDREEDPVGYLSVRYSYPKWMAEKFTGLFGEEFAESLMEAGNAVPDLAVRANTLKTSAEGLIGALKNEGVEALPGKYVSEAVVIKSHVSVAELEAYRKGLFQVQDEGSMLPALALAPQPGEKVLDACSAPGGKATHMAQLMRNRGLITAMDIHEHKLRLIEEAAGRLGTDIVRTELHDATIPVPEHEGAYDRVLLDAPCSGLGIIRRKPDIKWAKENRDLRSIMQLQRRLMDSVSKAVRPGGVLVYSTCTLLPEENESVVKDFLNENDEFYEDDITPFLPPGLAIHARGGMLQVYPNRDGTDGFFVARLARKVK
ncbi:MAG TPA: 16S rRNA (cytosine(967)-C(5))-methyltransferase RsmB [Clostridiales bacterium]|nr:16S rRNA (cytosine(967)-C(5))-methyltransferase RsmB [Clostridiales bacterium]HPV02654.1 16S rRNA (cytosine(967)-C(5))-methyltransferase RsmB [Clostridiales bacterium]